MPAFNVSAIQVMLVVLAVIVIAAIIIAAVVLSKKKKKTENFHTLRQELAHTQEVIELEKTGKENAEAIRQMQKNIRKFEDDDIKTRNLFSDSDIGLFSYYIELQDIKTGERFTTGIAGSITIGRRQECNLVFNRPTVSGIHCEIQIEEGGLVLTDQYSRNGTFINGIRVGASTRLDSGVILRLGQEEFLVTVSDFRHQPDTM